MRRWIRALWQKEPTRRLPAQRPASKRPGLEVLEDRCVPSVSATGQSFLLVAGHAPTQPVQIASFSDSTDQTGNPNSFTAKINWNDGSSLDATSASIALLSAGSNGSTYAVLASHVYSHTGSVPITIALHDALDNTDHTVYATAVVESGNQHFVENVYTALFNRQVDASGIITWPRTLDEGASRFQVVAQMEQGDEYRRDVVSGLYQKLLGRDVDPTGMQAWTTYLAHGHTTEQLQATLLASDEYFARRGGGTIPGWLGAVYGDVLNRSVDPSGARNWSHMLGTGFSRAKVAMGIVQSPEAFQVEIAQFYRQLLQRPPDAGGLASFVSQMQHGATPEQIIAGIVASDEFFSR